MMRRKLMVVCILVMIASLLTAAAAFADGETPEGETSAKENPVILFLASITDSSPDDIAAQKESGYSLGNVAPYKRFGDKRACFNFFRVVFRARSETARLVISDWAGEEEPGGPAGQELTANFVEVEPYWME